MSDVYHYTQEGYDETPLPALDLARHRPLLAWVRLAAWITLAECASRVMLYALEKAFERESDP